MVAGATPGSCLNECPPRSVKQQSQIPFDDSLPMKLALVWAAEARLVDITVRHELFVRGFEALGHDVITVCTQQAAEGYPYPVETAALADLTDPALWHRLRADVAVIVTWHMRTDVLAAIRSAGTRTIAIADSDGQVSLRVHPRATWRLMLAVQPRWDLKVRATKHWLQRLLRDSRREDLERIESTRQSDAVIFGTDPARENFRSILAHYGEVDLAARLGVAPYPVNEVFCEGPVPAQKRDRLVAVARWDCPQKDAALMAAALRHFCEQRASTEVLLIGRGGEPWFAGLTSRFPQARYLGVQAPSAIAALVAESRSIVFSSRWESGPIAAWETLALGGTVIGPPIPNFVSFAAGDQFGGVSPTRKPVDLAAAMRAEMQAWDEGRRNPLQAAAHWRERLRPAAVCDRLLKALPSSRATLESRCRSSREDDVLHSQINA
jgi:hypothetical protein